MAFAPPSRFLLAAARPRAAAEAVALGSTWPILRQAPRGDGHPVLVLPGFGASDVTTRPLRAFLRARGYHVHAWKLGRNLGPNPTTITGLRDRVGELARRHNRKMSLIGWSLGGLYAREIARSAPPVVRQVITLGSPILLRDRRATHAYRVFNTVNSSVRDPRPPEDSRGPLPVPATAIYSRTDGIVPWQSCLEVAGGRSESIEVPGSHAGLAHNPAVLWIVADRLAQAEGAWAPFERPGGTGGLLFGRRG